MGIGKRIKKRREELGITQTDLAIRLGYKDKSSISKIEKENNDIYQSDVVKFAQALGTSVQYLMGWTEEKEENEQDFAISEQETRIILAYRNADEIDQRSVLRILGLADKKNEPQLLAAHERKGVSESNIEELRQNDIDML